jgi:hypothetical protein
MINFSPFLALSGSFVTPAGFERPFSDAGVAAQRIPQLQKKVIEMAIRMRMDLLNIDFIIPPTNRLLHSPPFPPFPP